MGVSLNGGTPNLHPKCWSFFGRKTHGPVGEAHHFKKIPIWNPQKFSQVGHGLSQVFPTFPPFIPLAYYQAARICAIHSKSIFTQQTFGITSLVRILAVFEGLNFVVGIFVVKKRCIYIYIYIMGLLHGVHDYLVSPPAVVFLREKQVVSGCLQTGPPKPVIISRGP